MHAEGLDGFGLGKQLEPGGVEVGLQPHDAVHRSDLAAFATAALAAPGLNSLVSASASAGDG